MTLEPQELEKYPVSRWSITTSVPKSSGKARAITMSARISARYRSTSRVLRRSPSWILAADRGGISRHSPNSGMSPSDWNARRSSPPWRALTAVAKRGSRISSSSNCRKNTSTAFTPPASMASAPPRDGSVRVGRRAGTAWLHRRNGRRSANRSAFLPWSSRAVPTLRAVR